MMEFDDVAAWAAANISKADGCHFTIRAACDSFARTGVQLGKIRFSNRLQKLFPGAFHPKKTIGGVSINSVFLDLQLTSD